MKAKRIAAALLAILALAAAGPAAGLSGGPATTLATDGGGSGVH